MALIKILSLALLSSSLVAAAPRSAQLTRARRAAAPDPLLNNLVGGLARPFLNLFHLGGSKKPAARPRPAPRPTHAHVYHPAPVHVAAPDPAPAPAPACRLGQETDECGNTQCLKGPGQICGGR